MKRRMLALLLSCLLLLSLSACGQNSVPEEEPEDASRSVSHSTEPPESGEKNGPPLIVIPTPEPTPEPSPEPTPEPVMVAVDPAELPDSLEDFLQFFDFGFSDRVVGREYDCEKIEEDLPFNLLSEIVSPGSCVDFRLYPGEQPVYHWSDGTLDPRGWFETMGSYAEYDPQQIRWIAENVFDVPAARVDALIARAEEEHSFYLDKNADGEERFFSLIGGVGGPATIVRYETVYSDGLRYEIVYDYLIEPNVLVGTYLAELELREKDGLAFWALQKHTEELPETVVEPAPELFGMLDGTFYFASGIGAWWTEIEIAPDGSFTGHFQDSNMGESGDGFDGTLYYADFRGQFVNPQRVNAYTYSMELESLEYLDESEPFIVDEDGWRVLNTYSYAYGIEGGRLFYAYVPNAPLYKLPAGFVNWYGCERAIGGAELALPGWGLYNVDEDCGFAG